MVPVRGVRNPATADSRVDFPEPDGPSTARTSPGATETVTPSRAGTPSYWTARPVTSRTASAGTDHLARPVHRGVGRPEPQPADSGPEQQCGNADQQREHDGEGRGRAD